MHMYQVIIVEDDPMVAEIDKQYVEHNNKIGCCFFVIVIECPYIGVGCIVNK